MKIVCENCKTHFELDDASIQDPIFKVKCSECGHLFTASKALPTDGTTYILKKSAGPQHNSAPSVTKTTKQKIIAICNQKGGVGKTSTCLNLGISLSCLNKRVLLVDFDVQASLTILLGYKKPKSFYDLLDASAEEILAALEHPYHNCWLLPSNNKMMLLQNYNNKNFESILKDKLSLISQHFDYIIIDTPPAVEFFTVNALAASHLVIIPTQCEYLSLNGVSRMEEVIHSISQKRGSDLPYRVLVNLYPSDNAAAKVIHKKLKDTYQDKLFEVMIEADAKIQESQTCRKPIIYYDKNSKAALQYLILARVIDIQK